MKELIKSSDKIILRFHIIAALRNKWKNILSFLQAENNNVIHVIIEYASNELAYDFQINDNLIMFVDFSSKNYSQLRQLKRENIKNIMIFANALNKIRYNAIHETINIKIGDNVYLCLHQSYIISKLINHKLLH